MLKRISCCKTLTTLGDRVQLARTAGRVDHRPVLVKLWHRTFFDDDEQNRKMEFGMDKAAQLDRDKLRESVYRGKDREVFVGRLERYIGLRDAEVKELSSGVNPDRWWQFVNNALRDASQCFAKDPRRPVHRDESTVVMLEERSEMRAKLAALKREEHHDVECLVEEMKNVDKMIRKKKRRDWRAYMESVLEQLQDAWEKRDMAVCWRLARVLAGTKVGPRFRRYTVPTAARPS